MGSEMCIRDSLEAFTEWTDIRTQQDPIRLLQKIKLSISHGNTVLQPLEAAIQAGREVYNFKQHKDMSTQQYFERFKDTYTRAQSVGMEFGVPPRLLKDMLTELGVNDPDNPTVDETAAATKRARDGMLANLFLTNADITRNGDVMENLRNMYASGYPAHPKDLESGYRYLLSVTNNSTRARAAQQRGDYSFYNDGQRHDHTQQQGTGRGGRGGRGRNNGRGRNSGRGRG